MDGEVGDDADALLGSRWPSTIAGAWQRWGRGWREAKQADGQAGRTHSAGEKL